MTTLDPQRSALVLVDLMPRLLELELGPRPGAVVLEAAVALAERARSAGAFVVAIRLERTGAAVQPPGSELAPAVAALADAVVVKRTVGGYHGTGLDALLRERGIETLVMAGIRTNIGVESTARAAYDQGHRLVFVEDAMSARFAEHHEASVRYNLPRFGEVAPSSAVHWG
ncbi:isochorismatase family protein [Glycomyces paridis]|uniref:Isochorismatase family protein n=1 Tax=Glycomyces paridis TaxID=2126555 RepID=A0A4S8PJN0_9ACTN|nr:isochorismatase family protein [Glycomyces paridis]THV30903.1 isochorismatase family protein [Glycomyces paridis]